jgi:hypothetical protein
MELRAQDDIPFIGRGWSFPVTFHQALQGVSMVDGPRDIQQSLEVILGTQLGERMMHPQFGSDLSPLAFEGLTASLEQKLSDCIEKAILLHESRISLKGISFEKDPNGHCIYIRLNYLIRTTNTRMNLVYPFYRQEATNR